MSTKANWNLAALDLPEDDDPMHDITQGTPIDLTRDVDTIMRELRATVRIEGVMAQVSGITCALKDAAPLNRPPCATCPAFTDHGDGLARLCRLGRDQLDLIEELESVEAARRPQEIGLRAECEELAAAVL